MVTEEELKNMNPEELAATQKQNCIFCQIIEGQVPSKKIYEDERVLAFLDINPANPGHIILLPKAHHSILPQIPDDEVRHLFMISKKLSNALLKGLKVKGTNIFVANGVVAGQKAPHFLIHIIPRSEGDGLNFNVSSGKLDETSIEDVKQRMLSRIKQVFGLDDIAARDLGLKEVEQSQEPPSNPEGGSTDTMPAPDGTGNDQIDIDALKDVLEPK